MKKYFLFLLMFLPFSARAMCMTSYFDANGQGHLVRCGTNTPETKCQGKTYWNGRACVPVKIIEFCESQGGEWKQAQLRVPGVPDSSDPKGLNPKPSFVHLCVCPNKKVWDGKNCRSGIPLNKQCTNYAGDGKIRMTEEFFGSKNCPRISR